MVNAGVAQRMHRSNGKKVLTGEKRGGRVRRRQHVVHRFLSAANRAKISRDNRRVDWKTGSCQRVRVSQVTLVAHEKT